MSVSSGAMDNLINQTFGSGLWDISVIFTKDLSGISSIVRMSLIFGFLLWILQSAIEVVRGMEHHDNSWVKRIAANTIWLLIVVAMIKTPAYRQVVKYGVAVPAQACAESVTMEYIVDFNEAFQEVFSVYGESKNKPWSFITATVKGALVTQLLAALVYILTSVFVFILPVLQIKLFEYMYYIGPLCLIFSVCEWTKGVTRQWFSLILTVAWLGFFGSVSLLILVKSGVIENLSTTAGWDDVIPVMVYGIVSIVMLALAFPITSFLFSSVGSTLERLSNPGAVVSNTAAGLSGGVVAGAAAGTALGAVLANSRNVFVNKSAHFLKGLSSVTAAAGEKYGTASTGLANMANRFAKKQEEKHSTSVPKSELHTKRAGPSVPGKEGSG